ncbi:MAG: hypothetical protein GY851_27270 [bacterium]|nr:hypothetical protein [bacterium]
MRVSSLRCALVCVMLVGLVGPAFADEAAEAGRTILDAQKSTVVTVKTLIKISGMGSEEEIPTEVTGTVIDPTGLTVLALSSTDPTAMIKNMMGGMMGGNFDMSAQVTDVKILREDGSEIDAEIVLRDKDLDLAFVRPIEKPADSMACIDASTPGAPRILDELIGLNRLGKVARRSYAASIERVESVIEKPRTYYILGSQATQTTLGSPMFMLDGSFVGVIVMRSIKSDGSAGGMMRMLSGGGPDNIIPVVVPVADIQEAAAQAPAFGEKPAEETAEPQEEQAEGSDG